MLQRLSIRNYALIDNLSIDFGQGLTIITGETGAGKSIILGALSLLLGQRADSKYFFSQEKKCIIEGIFQLPDQQLQPIFDDYDLDFSLECILRREISIDGKSRAFINDTPVNLAVIKIVAEKLIAIHSQHASLEINDPEFQLLVVDALAQHGKLLNEYRQQFKEYKQNEFHLKEMIRQFEEANSRKDYEQFLFNELNEAKLERHEQELAETELKRLSNAESIKRNLLAVDSLLTANENNASTYLKESIQLLQQIAGFDNNIDGLLERLRSSLIEIKDISAELESLGEKTIWDPKRLEQLNDRLNLIYTLQQKHRVSSIDELIQIHSRLDESLTVLSNSDDAIEALQKTNLALKQTLTKNAEQIRKNRLNAIPKVEKHIANSLKKMAMPNAKLNIQLSPLPELATNGFDEVSLLFSANAGQAPAPVQKVASGGELSRLMLAIKALLATYASLPTLIFDEIDTGISGETANKVGEVLEQLAEHMQIFSITHLPQIAAKGKSHYYVYKSETSSKTTTGIRKLETEERVIAIAEMLSGKNPGSSAIQNARELLTKSMES